MALLRNILIVVLVSLSLTAFAQQKEAGQLQDLYLKGAYDKCLKKATKYAQDYPNQYQFPLYAAVGHWQAYKADNTATAELLAALQQLDLAYNLYGKKIGKFAAEQKQIHKAALKIGPTLLKDGKQEEAKALYGIVATVFKDTTEEFTWLYPAAGGTTSISTATASTLNNSQPSVAPPPSKYGSLVDNLLEYGRSFLGLPYKPAGCDPSGFDCSGFVSYLFKQFNVELPRSSQALAKVGTPIPLAQVKPADLLFYGYKKNGTYRTSHVALVYSHENGRLAFIHSSSRGVVIDDPDSSSWDYWEKRFLFARRVL